jgi:enolase
MHVKENFMNITAVTGLEVLDSRGKPTIRAFVRLDDGSLHAATVPSGASTGTYEALELRDGDTSRHLGQGVQKAVNNVNSEIAPLLIGKNVDDIRSLDSAMLALDGTENKSRLGANAILSVSLALVRAAAHAQSLPLWKFINTYYFGSTAPSFPRLMVNVVNGGKHANWNFDIQEFMIVPASTAPSTSTRVAAEIFAYLGKSLKSKGLSTLVGDEGGYSPALSSNEDALETIVSSAHENHYENGTDYNFALDSAASEFYENGTYVLKKDNRKISGEELIQYYSELGSKYGIISFEDPFSEDDWDNFSKFTALSHNNYLVVGDDLFVTNPKKLQEGIDKKAGNAILVKVNQIGSMSETVAAITLARSAQFKVIISHRSGETEDSFIADLAYGAGADYIKTGSMSRSDRLSKYNRLLEIEAGL